MNSLDSLTAATRAVHDAWDVLHAARRGLTEATVTAYVNGEGVARIAEHTGRTTIEVWNTLAVHGITPRSREL